MKKLTPAVLGKLRKCFKRAREKKARDLDKKVEDVMRAAAAEEGIEFAESVPVDTEHLYLNETGFVSALNNILGKPKYRPHAESLYRAIDRFHTGRVSWSQLVTRLVASGARATASRLDTWKPIKDAGALKLEHCKRETIVRLVSVETEESFSYVVVSRGGRVGIYSGDLTLLKSYEVFYHRRGVRSRVKNCWITDAVFMSDVCCMTVSASDRSLTVYDVSGPAHAPLYCVTGMPNIPTCLAYSPMGEAEYSELLVGTERGDLTTLRFLQPRVSLLHIKHPDTINYYFWMELTSPPHSTYCSTRTIRAHGRSVRGVTYARPDVVISCSHHEIALRLTHLNGKLDDYEISVHRGVSCFHNVSVLRLLATGSKDGIVRLWTFGQRVPLAKLTPGGASVPVMDVMIVDFDKIVIAYYKNCMVHIWDLYEECLLQSIKLKFPFLGVLGKKVDFGTSCIHLGPPRRKHSKDIPEGIDRSRRGSSVYEGSTGGLILLEPDSHVEIDKCAESERCEILITCNDYVYTLRMRDSDASPLRPAAGMAQGRRPSAWDVDMGTGSKTQSISLSPRSRQSPSETDIHLLQPRIHTTYDLDQLIANAGLEDILEKDFVLMRGLKHDLNKKLFEMESTVGKRKSAVSVCAPYLTLPRYTLDPLPTFTHLTKRYDHVKQYFPGPSVNVTPSASQSTTPRNKTINLFNTFK
ncbi:uncharacterized protein LOC110992736 [Pieris rapae]|uniref:uncharacterized protein LOC110992736 n=1 Tax=Pieris rapae TaxID=64459 RepID=UPI001E2801BD|nr:uncharacterized protein LOC110992736 [Pieris rapae]